MTLPASGQPISLNDIKTEYGAGGSRTLTTFYANANYEFTGHRVVGTTAYCSRYCQLTAR
jgi:hypothetical protein